GARARPEDDRRRPARRALRPERERRAARSLVGGAGHGFAPARGRVELERDPHVDRRAAMPALALGSGLDLERALASRAMPARARADFELPIEREERRRDADAAALLARGLLEQ